jgi:Zn ribbon nucleic-acid-binding protein
MKRMGRNQFTLGQMMAVIALFGLALGQILVLARTTGVNWALVLLMTTWLLPVGATLLVAAQKSGRAAGTHSPILFSPYLLLIAVLINLAIVIDLVKWLQHQEVAGRIDFPRDALFSYAAVAGLSWCAFSMVLTWVFGERCPGCQRRELIQVVPENTADDGGHCEAVVCGACGRQWRQRVRGVWEAVPRSSETEGQPRAADARKY